MHFITETLRDNPTLAIFLVLAIGFWVGNLKFRTFSLGVVTSTLLAGVLVGQLGITISPDIKSIFFLMFLFAVGYGVGPQFFQGLRQDGVKQVLFACVQCVACLICAWAAGLVLHYDAGSTAGLLSGASTISSVLGVATETINGLPGVSASEKQEMLNHMPVAYAVTYIFGTAGSAWVIAKLGPKILRVNLRDECKKLEASLGATEAPADVLSAYTRFVVRAYKAPPVFAGKTILEVETYFAPLRIFVERLRSPDNKIIEATPATPIPSDATLVLYGPRADIIAQEHILGPEMDDRELLDYQGEILDVVVTKRSLVGKSLKQIAAEAPSHTNGRGIFVRKIVRAGRELPRIDGITVQRGDTLTLIGRRGEIEAAAKHLGYADRTTDKTDMVFMGLGIVVGALIGTLAIHIGSIPVSLSSSGGALIAGLICGWLRSTHHTFGRIPSPAIWVFNNVGLNTFIAVVGITAGPAFIDGLKANGLSLLVAGIFVTSVPLIIGMLVGKYIFRMHPGILLGAVSGARTTTAALGAVEEVAQSKVPALGYTVTYAVGNTLLTIWGMVIVLMST